MPHRVCNRISIFKKCLRTWSTSQDKKVPTSSGLIAVVSPPERSPLWAHTTGGLFLTLTLKYGGRERKKYCIKTNLISPISKVLEGENRHDKIVRETVGHGEDTKIAFLYCCSHIDIQVEDTGEHFGSSLLPLLF